MIGSFLDTNILLYAASNSPDDTEKKKIASDLIRNSKVWISTQVLQEFIANALRKRALQISEEDIHRLLHFFLEEEVQAVNLSTVQRANEMRLRFNISQWDASILSAAEQMGCSVVYTEHLNHGQIYDRVQVLNPFHD